MDISFTRRAVVIGNKQPKEMVVAGKYKLLRSIWTDTRMNKSQRDMELIQANGINSYKLNGHHSHGGSKGLPLCCPTK